MKLFNRYKRHIIAVGLLLVSLPQPYAQSTTESKPAAQNQNTKSSTEKFIITGRVFDENKQLVIGATILEAGTKSNGTATDAKGAFQLAVSSPRASIVVSYVGMVKRTIEINSKAKFDIYMTSDVNQIETTVVTGYFSKAKNSFTGTAVVVKGEQLQAVNNTNFFDALKVFDPSFQVVDVQGLYGSNPNHVPDQIEIRGQNSFPEISENGLKTVTSLPVFMLDGFEIKVEEVYDLDMNRIKSVTILKDASASAIYGSRAANGVVVIESKDPEPGALRISYSMVGGVSVPDLSSYNLMNAGEALEFQRLAGVFDASTAGEDPGSKLNSYNVIRKEVLSGVDTYWLSKPLQVGIQHRHSVAIEGSVGRERAKEETLRYRLNVAYGETNGVMKGSKRTNYGAGTKLLYNRGTLNISNDLQLTATKNADSPYGNFSNYTSAMPYHREKDENGNYYRTLSLRNVAPEGMELGVASSQLSPVYEAKYLSSFSASESFSFRNNTAVNWAMTSHLRVRGDISVSNNYTRKDAYVSPMSYSYNEDESSDVNSPSILYDRGKYELGNENDFSLTGKLVLSYSRSIGLHSVQTIVGGEMSEAKLEGDSYLRTGFLSDGMDYISHSAQYQISGRPMGSESTVRSAGAFANANYSYDDRYLIDLTGRIDGSSLYGRNQRTTPFWSVGTRWNVHNEEFFKGSRVVEKLALRANIGTVGNQNYSRNQATSLYTFLPQVYGGIFGASVTTLGNPDLEFQTTVNRNIGLEVTLLKGLLNLDFNYYYNTTKGNIIDITIAPSLGFSTLKVNQGDLLNKGVDFSLTVNPVRTKDWLLSISLRGRHNSNLVQSISNTLKNYNNSVLQNADKNLVNNVFLFEEGQSMNTIYAVPSLGIDPGTGREIYIARNGEQTFDWKSEDMVAVGVGEAVIDGYTGFNLSYRGWTLGSDFRYSIGADRYNSTLHSKIENISNTNNNDRRALTERWTHPGQRAKYKAITDNSRTNPTSRFVQKENMFSLTSLRVAYTVPVEKLGWQGVSMLKFSVTANDLFYFSTIKQERGLYYPFARNINFSAQINF